jgi:hypothetical protein
MAANNGGVDGPPIDKGGHVENTSVSEAGFPLDDLQVEELEPRLEFAAIECGYLWWQEGCVICFNDSGPDIICGSAV